MIIQVEEVGFGDGGEVDAPAAAEVAVVYHVYVDGRLLLEARDAMEQGEPIGSEAPRGGRGLVPGAVS